MKRTHTCNALRRDQVGQEVTLVGWVDVRRDHGGIQFIDLRDREGITQILFTNEDAELSQQADRIRPESVIEVTGTVRARGESEVNAKLPTGEIEVVARQLTIHNVAETPPFPLDDDKANKVNEDLRLQYRFLDLRRPNMYRNLRVRSKAAKAMRDYLDSQEFLEIETPSLFKSTPEGAREFLVPSRLNPGKFYALNQSPQQYKQMLMVAGVERYYQLARCFRDEDLRADRQPEFTQIDIEMSFIDREDMYATMEGLMKRIWKDVLGVDLQTPFPRMSYFEAMNRYGVDKPDTRFGLTFEDFTEAFKNSSFKVFKTIANSGDGAIKAMKVPELADLTQGEHRDLENTAKNFGAKGLAFIRIDESGEWKSPIVKFFSDEEKAALQERLDIQPGDLVLFSAAEWERACTILGRVRLECAKLLVKREKLELSASQYNFLWVIEFPLMLHDEEQGRYVAAHHPFTAPVPEDVELLDSDPKAVRGQHYDLVLNGWEIGGGSIRIHQPELQKKVFEDVLQIPKDVVQERFGYMLNAFRYGAPPHGGIAFGFDRMITLMTGATSIREVIAFPKTQKGQDLMADAPTTATPRQLRDLHIETVELDEEADAE
ncbi:MAG: aspartyl-tRNA synthetase [Puniceicoccaceae bacterium 5H]|nr:MAG: aspartyl-tRNA synthetase [Puniceicoccaceae bacterium 5H]